MLREIRNTQQVPGELPRRWFFSEEQDFLVWISEDGKPAAFQLAYDKYREEHAIRWKVDRGFSHHRVDDGERGGTGKEAALLYPDGTFEVKRVLDQFLALSKEMPSDLVEFVATKLREHPEYREEN